MRIVVVGAGAIGGLVGGRLAQHGHDVLLVARGAHGAAIRSEGLSTSSTVRSFCSAGCTACPHP
jgi:ketopantoate reductase